MSGPQRFTAAWLRVLGLSCHQSPGKLGANRIQQPQRELALKLAEVGETSWRR
jgi:hypothetical protein